jgi:hypothetical protein
VPFSAGFAPQAPSISTIATGSHVRIFMISPSRTLVNVSPTEGFHNACLPARRKRNCFCFWQWVAFEIDLSAGWGSRCGAAAERE